MPKQNNHLHNIPAQLHNIPAQFFKALSEIELPPEWGIIKAEIKFERKGFVDEWATVIWDPGTAVFYATTQRAVIYPGDMALVNEAVEIMNKANAIVRRPKIETDAKPK